jgi:glycosyltransferase involved in cell wall biosynthesis
MAKKFVHPLMDKEAELGIISELFVSRGLPDRKHVIPFDIGLNLFFYGPIAIYRLLKVIYVFKPDIVIAHNSRSALLPLLAATILGVQNRVYFNHGVPYIGYQGFLRLLLKSLDRVNLFFSNQVITVSKDMASLLQEISGSTRCQPFLLGFGSACGIDLTQFKLSSVDDRSKKTWVFVGRPEVRKGFKLVLDLWDQYFKDTDFTLILCGPTEAEVLRFLPRVPVNIKCLGFIDNIETILSKSTGLILPSFHEGFSYAILEAMACGATVIANNIPGVRNIIRNSENGFLIDGNALSSYANVIHVIDEYDELRQAIVVEGRLSANQYERVTFLNGYASYLLELS